MSDVTIDRFDEYFRELHGREPYSWQTRLARRAVVGVWPPAIDLPTGSGKTACIDIAIFAMACQAAQPMMERTAPRRVFFCVNRRVIVDEAHERAAGIAKAIWQAERGGAANDSVLRHVAAALRMLAGTGAQADVPPLDVLELRGGIYRDNRWARSATQPTVVCTTIDQLGSRLLFRGYGVSPGAAPIQAAMITYDSLILLDEAHVSRPFFQTLTHVTRYLDPERWAERTIGACAARVVPMTATPPKDVNTEDVIRLDEADRANESLNDRLRASKPAELRKVTDTGAEAVEAAKKLASEKPAAVGIIVNRVATARAVYSALMHEPDTVVELVIGSMRPIDRDNQADRLRPLVGKDRPLVTSRRSYVVATQCLEVGADYDFDGLVTECASLDALRQRFGRLNRGGRKEADGTPFQANAVILASKENLKADDKLAEAKPLDPIYGNALARTWNWLNRHSSEGSVDFGIDAFDARLKKHGEDGRILSALLSPSAALNAPVLLPAYVDFWCQTAPRPVPDPDVSLFLHGPRAGELDVQVCWRADIGETGDHPAAEHWIDVVALLPPTSAECMTVPISRVRRWLAGDAADPSDRGDVGTAELADVDETATPRRKPLGVTRRGVLWRGLKKSVLIRSAGDVRPGDVVVLPVGPGGWDKLGHLPSLDRVERLQAHVDCAEAAFVSARDRVAFRIHPAIRPTWPPGTDIDTLFERLAEVQNPPAVEELRTLLQNANDALAGVDSERADLLRLLARESKVVREYYPDGCGVVLTSRHRLGRSALELLPALDDGDDEPTRTFRETPVNLADHTRHVIDAVERALSLLPVEQMAEAFRFAAPLHDAGKADERFQAMLCRADRTDAWLRMGGASAVLAKSDGLPLTRSERDAARRRAGLPAGFRHEMLSVELVERSARLPTDPIAHDLALHLIAAHHGYARPFAPVVVDDEPPDVSIEALGIRSSERLARPSHRLDSGIADRFWSLTRHFGWWGLAYLEAVFRLADQQASADEDAGRFDDEALASVEVAS